jgi:hypothetical protein
MTRGQFWHNRGEGRGQRTYSNPDLCASVELPKECALPPKDESERAEPSQLEGNPRLEGRLKLGRMLNVLGRRNSRVGPREDPVWGTPRRR